MVFVTHMPQICALDLNRDRKQSKCNKQYLSAARICAVDRIDRRPKPMMQRIEINEVLFCM